MDKNLSLGENQKSLDETNDGMKGLMMDVEMAVDKHIRDKEKLERDDYREDLHKKYAMMDGNNVESEGYSLKNFIESRYSKDYTNLFEDYLKSQKQMVKEGNKIKYADFVRNGIMQLELVKRLEGEVRDALRNRYVNWEENRDDILPEIVEVSREIMDGTLEGISKEEIVSHIWKYFRDNETKKVSSDKVRKMGWRESMQELQKRVRDASGEERINLIARINEMMKNKN